MKRYWLAWFNEIGKLAVGIFLSVFCFSLWLSPVSSNDRMLGIAIGVLGIMAFSCLADVPFSIYAIHKGTHKLLRGAMEK